MNKQLVIKIQEIKPGEELKYYSSVIEKTISFFGLNSIDSYSVKYGNNYDEYYWKKETLLTSIIAVNGREVQIGYTNFFKPENKPKELYKNLPFVIEGLNRFLSEEGINHKLVIYEVGGNLELDYLSLSDAIETEKLLKAYNYDFFSAKFDTQTILNAIKHYEDRDVFRRLPDKIIKQGKELVKSYNPISLQDVLWQFENLIIICCPRESGDDYQGVLNDFIKGTHGELKISDFKKTLIDNDKCSISFKVNDKEFKTKYHLPIELSLGLIYQLNSFLSKEFNRTFYIWDWERNCWEQRAFIYLSNSTYNNYFNRMNEKEITPLYDYVVDFYDENR